MISWQPRGAPPPPWISAAIPVGSVLAAFLLGAGVLAAAGVNPLAVYAALVGDPFGSAFGLAETIVKATPLILTGLAVLLPARSR